MASGNLNERLVRKLQSIAEISAEDAAAILAMPIRVMKIAADRDIVSDGDRPSRSCLLAEGYACRYKLTPPGRRQILSFHIAGDVPDLQSLHLGVMDHSLATLARCTVGFIEHETLRRLFAERPKVATVCWRDTLIDAAIFREWMTGLGRRDAAGKVAHLFCELSMRMAAVGLADRTRFPMPFTQVELGDALGLSTVHVNRTLMDLRERGIVTVERGQATILDRDALWSTGEFDETYLHLKPLAA